MDGVETESMAFEYTNENWRDQLTKVNDKTITYDQIGNPLSDGTWTYTWKNGRQLQKMQKSGETVEFIYNENGLRVQKTATSTGVTKYTLHGKNIVHMTQGSNKLHFFYDTQNKPAVVVFNGTPYSYVKNLQGDIVAILDSNKDVVVSYVYDAWGRPISCSGTMANTLGKINPFRYRGYVYDEETGLYYLQSRYYAPEKVRFLNADIYVSTGHGLLDSNTFAYCRNNPIIRSDAAGTEEWDLADVDGGAGLDSDEFGKCPGGGGVHGNSKLSTKPQHGYEIYDTQSGDVVKTGISGQKINFNGTSPRANTQVNKLNAAVGSPQYGARIVQTMPNRQTALEWERMNALRLWNEGHSMSIHLRPKLWEDIR